MAGKTRASGEDVVITEDEFQKLIEKGEKKRFSLFCRNK